VTLPAFTAERRAAAPLLLNLAAAGTRCQRSQLSIDISCPLGAQQQTRRPPLLLSIDGTDRRMDGRTDRRTLDRFIDPAAHTMRTVLSDT